MNSINFNLLIAALFIIFGFNASANLVAINKLAPTALLNRCYAFLTGFPISQSDDRYKQVQNNKTEPLAVCAAILEKAVADSKNREILNYITSPLQYQESQRVIQNFYNLHRSWFESMTPNMSTHLTGEVFDFSEPALTLNHHLFQEMPYREVVLGTDSYRAIRHYNRKEIPSIRSNENGQILPVKDSIGNALPADQRDRADSIIPTVLFSKFAVRENNRFSVGLKEWVANFNHSFAQFSFYDPTSTNPNRDLRIRLENFDLSSRRVTVGKLVTTELDKRSFVTPTSMGVGYPRLPQCGSTNYTQSPDNIWNLTSGEIKSRCVRRGGSKSYCNDRNEATASRCEAFCVERHVQCQNLCATTDGGNFDGSCNLRCRQDTVDYCNSGDGRMSRWAEDSAIGLQDNIDISKSFGAGLLGTQTLLMNTTGMSISYRANGEATTQRRWSNNLLNKLACQTLPTLRLSDVVDKVRSGGISFRSSATCVTCHATMDPLSHVIRNLTLSKSLEFRSDLETANPQNVRGLDFVSQYSVSTHHTPDYCRTASEADKAQWRKNKDCQKLLSCGEKLTWPESWCHQAVDNFSRKEPTGRLFFRSYTGALVDNELKNLEDAGIALANTDDYYACAAKNYFSYFTGNTVSLYDMGNPANSNLNREMTKAHKIQRDFVHQLGQSFKTHQSQKNLILEIMRSPFFESNDFKVEEEQ